MAVASSQAAPQMDAVHVGGDDSSMEPSSLIIPITSSSVSKDLFIEIFPEEVSDIPSSTLLQVLKDEDAELNVWADAALLYIQQKASRESSAILQAACDRPGGNRDQRVRILASAGIAHLTQAQQSSSSVRGDAKDYLRTLADNRFTQAGKVDTLFPMTWMGRGMLNLSLGRMDQAKFFFDTTLKQCGQVLPALLGMAAVLVAEKDYKGAQDMYGKAMRLYPQQSGASTRVGFGLACYRLGQVDRAKAAFARALEMDPENVDAMVGAAILDMASFDASSRDFRSRTEKAIKMMSMANLLDHSNAMVQNHLANHYFWKWTPVSGTVELTQGSREVKASQPIPLDPGERIRIGSDFETYISEDATAVEGDNTSFQMRVAWKAPSISGLKLWKKDYDRVIALAKGAYNSTAVQEIQAESLFLLARVHHVREDIENAHKLYERACKFAPDLSPARFGLAQTLIAQGEYEQAAAHLRLVLGTSSTATDAMAALGLLEVKAGNNPKEGLTYLKKAVDLDPLNPDLIILEALALQQQKSTYSNSLERYNKAVELLENQKKKVPYEIYTNIGVLYHETGKYDEALGVYCRALRALDGEEEDKEAKLDNVGVDGGYIRHKDNSMFYGFVDTGINAICPAKEGAKQLKLESTRIEGISAHPFRTGDHVRLGDDFQSEILEILEEEGEISIRIKDTFVPPSGAGEIEEPSDEGSKDVPMTVSLAVKRENNLLANPLAISIAFNLARLHEVAGRILAAVELHKAIVKRNPAYVNSYLCLACIARDCGSLKECSAWLKIACAVAPGNAEVLTLVGNLHLSLCDWAPAQSVFDQLLAQKVPNVEAYAMLSLGNIYFANLKAVSEKYAKHLQHATDYYRRILTKDKGNAFAANGLGTVLAEKGELFKAKEVFNRVREVSGDSIADAHLNLGHIFLAQKKHPEALQMYQSYMKRTQDGTVPITTKSRDDDLVEVLLYIAFTYFDWARQTELYNNANSAPADGRYQKCIEHLELAISKRTRKDVILQYNLCMTKLQAANCVLQKLTRNIRRTAQEVQDALDGLNVSLPKVQELLTWKIEGKKIPIHTSMLQDFITHCKANIESAKSHLEEEKRREAEANEIRELQRVAAESQRREEEIRLLMQREEEAKRQEERDRKAEAKMRQVEQLRAGWDKEVEAKKAAAEKKDKRKGGDAPPVEEDAGLFDDEIPISDAAALFDDSDDDDVPMPNATDTGSGAADGDDDGSVQKNMVPVGATEKDLFGDSSDESDEELVPSGTKRVNDSDLGEDENMAKKRRFLDEDD